MRTLAALALFATAPAAAQPAPAEARVQIEAVVESFRMAIVTKDRARFLALFLTDRPTWQSVDSDALVQTERERGKPGASKVAVRPENSHLGFIDSIVGGPDREEERFQNVVIDTDGNVAAVSFDFTFHLNDRVINRGRESWHLVNTGVNGWKIVSVIYSNN